MHQREHHAISVSLRLTQYVCVFVCLCDVWHISAWVLTCVYLCVCVCTYIFAHVNEYMFVSDLHVYDPPIVCMCVRSFPFVRETARKRERACFVHLQNAIDSVGRLTSRWLKAQTQTLESCGMV